MELPAPIGSSKSILCVTLNSPLRLCVQTSRGILNCIVPAQRNWNATFQCNHANHEAARRSIEADGAESGAIVPQGGVQFIRSLRKITTSYHLPEIR